MRLPASLPSRDPSPYLIMDLRGVDKYPMEAEDRREHTAFTHAARRGTPEDFFACPALQTPMP